MPWALPRRASLEPVLDLVLSLEADLGLPLERLLLALERLLLALDRLLLTLDLLLEADLVRLLLDLLLLLLLLGLSLAGDTLGSTSSSAEAAPSSLSWPPSSPNTTTRALFLGGIAWSQGKPLQERTHEKI